MLVYRNVAKHAYYQVISMPKAIYIYGFSVLNGQTYSLESPQNSKPLVPLVGFSTCKSVGL